MKKARNIILGIAIILAAIGAAVAALLDNDPLTKPDIKEVIIEVREGVEIIKGDEEKEEVAAEPEEPAEVVE